MVESGALGSLERPIIAAALVRSAEVEETMRTALAEHPYAELRARFADGPDPAALRELKGDVILVDLDARNPQELEMLTEFVAGGTRAPIVVTSPWLDVGSMCELMRIGIHHVVPQPLNGGELTAVLERALTRHHAAPISTAPVQRKGIVIGYIGSGGGVGATSLAVQGACALGRRKTDAPEVCLLDLDIQFGGAALLIDAEQRGSIIDLIESADRLDGVLLRHALTPAANRRFDLLAAPAAFQSVDDIDPDRIATVIDIAASEYLVTILDVPLLWSHWTHAALRGCDRIVLVVQPTVASVRQAKRQIAMLRSEELDDIPLFVVANRVDSGPFSHRAVTLSAAESALGRKFDFVVPETAAIKAAAEAGKPLADVRGGRAVEKKLARMLERVTATRAEAEARPAAPRGRPGLSLPRWLRTRPTPLVFGH